MLEPIILFCLRMYHSFSSRTRCGQGSHVTGTVSYAFLLHYLRSSGFRTSFVHVVADQAKVVARGIETGVFSQLRSTNNA